MLARPNLKPVVRVLPAVFVLLSGVALISATKSPFTTQDKAYYADPNLVNYVRPGLVVKILSAQIANDGTITARVRFTDRKGAPLDINGIETPGAISNGNPGMVAAYIPKGGYQYVAYTTRTQNSTIRPGQSAVQAGADSGGRWTKVADGEYTYTFGTKAPANFDKSATHSIGCYANRNLTEFGFGTDLDDDVYSWVPDGSSKPAPRDVVRTQSCQKCHVDTFAFHGTTGRTSMEMCVLCHTPQTTDPDSGNTVDMPYMVHAIHMGEDLAKPYVIYGFGNAKFDFSDVAIPTDKRNCQVCHDSKSGAAQAGQMLTRPTRAACGGCHNGVNFATGEGHLNLPQPSDNQCAQCHIPQGELEFDASILGAHTIDQNSTMLSGIKWAITRVDNAKPGQKPTITFTLADKNNKPLALSDMARIYIVMGGPTTDYITKWPGQSTAGYVSEDASRATGSNGTYTYTMTNALPADAKGTFSVALDGRRQETIYEGTRKERSVQYGAKNPIFYFSVDGSPVTPRRKVVAIEKCQACHVSLRLHGNNRWDNIEHCVTCHNPVETDAARRPANAGAPQSVDFRQMIHNIHGGAEIKAYYGVEDYIVFGFGGSVNNFSDVRYPGRLATCSACHDGNSYQLPLPATNAEVNNPRGYLNPAGPESAACLSCHRSLAAASHALSNTTKLGEACAACHGPNSEFAVSKVHAALNSPAPKE